MAQRITRLPTEQKIAGSNPAAVKYIFLIFLYRHKKVCEKVSTKKRQVFDLSKKRTDGQDIVPSSNRVATPKKTKIVKPEDEFQECPSCSRKFGPKAYDRHVKWCMEKARRISNSPKKDLEALAKLQTRVTYRYVPPKYDFKKKSLFICLFFNQK